MPFNKTVQDETVTDRARQVAQDAKHGVQDAAANVHGTVTSAFDTVSDKTSQVWPGAG